MKKNVILVLVIVILLAGGYFYWSSRRSSTDQPATTGEKSTAADQKEIEALVAKVGRLMILPKDEIPQVAEINNATLAAKEQPFYVDAKNGDKLLVYLSLRKAIIYSPSRNLIVNVGPIYLDEDAAAAESVQPVAAPEPAPADAP